MKGFNFTTGRLREPRVHASTNIGRIQINSSVRKGFMYLLFFGATLWAAGLHAQTLQPNMYVTNGTVYSAVVSGNTVYVGGIFTYVEAATGGGAGIDTSTGSMRGLPRVSGNVDAVVPDGSGGWYIAGAFKSVGFVSRNNIAHIKSDKTVDGTWNPSADQEVHVLCVSGSTVYAGGSFQNIGGSARVGIAALDATTGIATSWNPNPDNGVLAIAVSGSTVYAGGYFTHIGVGDSTRHYIAAINASSGIATAWNPNANFDVLALVISGSTVYAGGDFTKIGVGDSTRHSIAAIDASSGIATAWNPSANGGTVEAIAVSGSTVYAGGFFVNIGGITRNHIAAINASSGIATAWNPNANNDVFALAVSGSTVYAGGYFTNIGVGDSTRYYIAAINASSGTATAWNPNPSGANGGDVLALAVSGSTVYAGGNFQSLGGIARKNIAAFDLSSGAVTAWNPNAKASGQGVYALAISGSTVYAGGGFIGIGDSTRYYIAAIDASSGIATAWNPNPTYVTGESPVLALAVSGSTIYAGGQFTFIGDSTRYFIAAFKASSSIAKAWNPNGNFDGIHYSGPVTTLAISGSKIYAGGNFQAIGDSLRNDIAALDTSTGIATAWNPNPAGEVDAIAVSGSTVYAAGEFLTIGGVSRYTIAAINASSGAITTWNPNPNTGAISALAVSGSTVYVGGSFTSIGGQTRQRIAAVDATTGLATAWNPNVPGNILTIALSPSNNTVYFGGTFENVSNFISPFFAGMTDPADVALPAEIASISATPSLDGVKIQWKTASEVNLAGFDVLRSASQNGPFTLISGYATNKSLLAAGSISFGTSYSYTDATVESGKTYYYNLDWVDKDGTQKEVGGVLQVTASLPKTYALFQNYPNPFNPSTTIRFDLKQASTVVLDIYNILGEKVEEWNYGTMNAGEYSKAFDMSRFASGVYLYRINALGNDGEKFVEMKKLVLMK